jgi:hypothetical protein
LEHDLVYKPLTGDLSVRETDSLDVLGNLTLTGDIVIKQLVEANAERIKQARNEAVPFQDVYDFVARMRDEFADLANFGRNAGQLFEDLVSLGFETPEKVREHFLTEHYAERSSGLLRQLEQYLRQQNDNTVQVEAWSSDALLVLVLDSHTEGIIALHPLGRGRGRAPRIATFAHRFRQMKEHQRLVGEPPSP